MFSEFQMITVREKMIRICDEKIAKKGTGVNVSFYAFFSNKNDNPSLLMEVAEWWIMKQKLDHFEKALKIRDILLSDK
jgi:hypothetical protein